LNNIHIFSKLFLFFIIFYLIFKINNLKEFRDYLRFKNKTKDANYIINLNSDNENKTIYFNMTFYNASYSFKYNIVEITYLIHVCDENKNRIQPFELFFNYDLNIFCNMKIIEENNTIETFPSYYNNISLICTEYFELNEIVELGIKIYKKVQDIYQNVSYFYFFDNKNFNFSNLHFDNDNKFAPFKIKKEYIDLMNEIKNNNEKLTLKNSYIQNPFFNSKTRLQNDDNKWIFKNIYNQYFCFCKGLFCKKNISIFQNCKYYFYLSIIDKLRDLFEKTDYLLADFIDLNFNDDDILPIFKRMIGQNLPAHFISPKENLYKEFCFQKSRCLTILNETFIDGDFLEKYLNLILRLKATVAGSDFRAINNLFFNIEYITNINVGHGVKFFKSFLYMNYTSPKRYNKLVLAPSSKLITIAEKYGWKEKNIIKLCLPKWDKYKNKYTKKIRKKFIFIFFTWREINANQTKNANEIVSLSNLYIINILLLLNNKKLNDELIKNNITLLFGLHENLYFLKDYINTKYKFIKVIKNEMISNALMKSSLIVTDFSSVIFDFIYQKKPAIIYIPDYNDPKIKDLYSENYYNLIKSLGNGTIYFENKFYNVNDVVDKIISYINNGFKLEKKIKKFYNSFGFKCQNNNIQLFIEYLKNLK